MVILAMLIRKSSSLRRDEILSTGSIPPAPPAPPARQAAEATNDRGRPWAVTTPASARGSPTARGTSNLEPLTPNLAPGGHRPVPCAAPGMTRAGCGSAVALCSVSGRCKGELLCRKSHDLRLAPHATKGIGGSSERQLDIGHGRRAVACRGVPCHGDWIGLLGSGTGMPDRMPPSPGRRFEIRRRALARGHPRMGPSGEARKRKRGPCGAVFPLRWEEIMRP